MPGDVIEVPSKTILPCDLILLTGIAIVNESMLTGESVPVIKNGIPKNNDVFDLREDSKYILFSGTNVL